MGEDDARVIPNVHRNNDYMNVSNIKYLKLNDKINILVLDICLCSYCQLHGG